MLILKSRSRDEHLISFLKVNKPEKESESQFEKLEQLRSLTLTK
jgi:hypothetical protein